MTLEKEDIHKHTLEIIYRAIKQRDAETFNCIFALSYMYVKGRKLFRVLLHSAPKVIVSDYIGTNNEISKTLFKNFSNTARIVYHGCGLRGELDNVGFYAYAYLYIFIYNFLEYFAMQISSKIKANRCLRHLLK